MKKIGSKVLLSFLLLLFIALSTQILYAVVARQGVSISAGQISSVQSFIANV